MNIYIYIYLQGDNVPPEIEKEANKLLKEKKKTKDGNPGVEDEPDESNDNDQVFFVPQYIKERHEFP